MHFCTFRQWASKVSEGRFSSIKESLFNEAEFLLAEIKETKEKIKCAWNHLDYAAPEYVEIAVLELLIAETQYSLLNKRYRLLMGINKEYPLFESSPPNRKTSSFSLEDNLRSHAFYGTLFNAQQKVKT